MRPIKFKYIKHFIIAMLKHAYNKFKKASKLEVEMRLHECLSCINLDNTKKPWEHCNLCGCPVRKKVKLSSESCPAGKW